MKSSGNRSTFLLTAKGERTRMKRFGRPDDSDRPEMMENDAADEEERDGQCFRDEHQEDEP
jgi:hypothetical protein